MRRNRLFWKSFFLTLTALLPLYLGVAAWCGVRIARAKKAEETGLAQSGVRILQPTGADCRTLLVMTGGGTAQTPESYVLLRFDALHNAMAAAALPPETEVRLNGRSVLLRDAVADAGPFQGTAALRETLDIPIDNYLFCAPDTLAEIVQPLGSAGVDLEKELSPETLGALQLDVPGSGTRSILTAQMLADVLQSDAVPRSAVCAVRAQGYLEFLRSGTGRLQTTLCAGVRACSPKLATDLTATQLFDYERIFRFLDREEAVCSACALPGTWQGGRYVLSGQAAAWAALHLQAQNKDAPPAESGLADSGTRTDADGRIAAGQTTAPDAAPGLSTAETAVGSGLTTTGAAVPGLTTAGGAAESDLATTGAAASNPPRAGAATNAAALPQAGGLATAPETTAPTGAAQTGAASRTSFLPSSRASARTAAPAAAGGL